MLTAADGISNLVFNSLSATRVQQEPTSSMTVGTLKASNNTNTELQFGDVNRKV
jgi:hypothetical protein